MSLTLQYIGKCNMILRSALILYATAGLVTGDAFDAVRNAFVDPGELWMEAGHVSISRHQWTGVAATYTRFKDPAVFLSLPSLAGDSTSTGASISLRVKDINVTQLDNSTSYFEFKVRSFTLNSSFCLMQSQFYTPSELDIGPAAIGWLVVERGVFQVSGKTFIIQSAQINRTTSSSKDDAVNQFKADAPEDSCFNGSACELSGGAPYLSIAQLQTSRFERFLSLRGVGTSRSSVTYILELPDSAEIANYIIPSPGELYAWILFEGGVRISCEEHLTIESALVTLTEPKSIYIFASSFMGSPYLFGNIGSLVGRDAVTLRVFNGGVSQTDMLAQEDKCLDEETSHVSGEVAHLLIIGHSMISGSTVCGAVLEGIVSTSLTPTLYPTNTPSLKPTELPTLSPTMKPTHPPTFIPSQFPSTMPSTPTVRPTRQPTTEVVTAISIAGSTVLDGATCSDVVILSAFQNAIEHTLGIGPDGVFIDACDHSILPLQFRELYGMLRQTEGLSSALDFSIQFILEEKGYTYPYQAFRNVDRTLNAALNNGNLVGIIKTQSGSNVSLSAMVMQSYSIDERMTRAPTSSPTESAGIDNYFGGTIYYITYGVCGGFLVLIICMSCYFYIVKRDDLNEDKPIKRSRSFEYVTKSELDFFAEGKGSRSAALAVVAADRKCTQDMEVIIALIAEHRQINLKLRAKLMENRDPNHEPALLRFIIDSFDPSKLSKDHKKLLKEYLKKMSAENASLWARSVCAGLYQETDKPEILKVKLLIGDVDTKSIAPQNSYDSKAIHFSMDAMNRFSRQEKEFVANSSVDSHSADLKKSSASASYDGFSSDCIDSEDSTQLYLQEKYHCGEPDVINENYIDDFRENQPISLCRVTTAADPVRVPRNMLKVNSNVQDTQKFELSFPNISPPLHQMKVANLSTVHGRSMLRKSLSLEDIRTNTDNAANQSKFEQPGGKCGEPIIDNSVSTFSNRFGKTRRRKHDLESYRRIKSMRMQRRKSVDTASLDRINVALPIDDQFDLYGLWDVPRTNVSRKQFVQAIMPTVAARNCRPLSVSQLAVTSPNKSPYSAFLIHALSTVAEDPTSRQSFQDDESVDIISP